MSIKVVLLRHGESQWNKENRFTGWHDVPLSAKVFFLEIYNLNLFLKKNK